MREIQANDISPYYGHLLVVGADFAHATVISREGWDPMDRDEVLTRIGVTLNQESGADMSWVVGGEEKTHNTLYLGVNRGATHEQGWADVVRLLAAERGPVRILTQTDVALAQQVWSGELD